MNTLNQTKSLKAVDMGVIGEMLARINKLEARAKKKGFYEPLCNVVVSDSYFIKKGHGIIEVADLEVSMIDPFEKEWSVMAKIDFSLGSENPVVSGAELPEGYNKNSCHCDHCGVKRERNTVYVVTKAGSFMQVGSSCLKDFYGVDPTDWLKLWSMDLNELADECSGQSGPIFYNAVNLLAIASKINGMYGFRAMSKEDIELGKWATASRVRAYLHSNMVFKEIGSITDADKEFALKVKEHILNKKGANQYISNIQSLLNAEYVKFDHINLLVSALGVYLKEVNSSDKATYTENFIGTVKDKVEMMVLVESIRPVETYYGVSYLVKMTTPDHYLVTWFASKEPEMEIGSTYSIKGTVKKHEVYNNIYQTSLTRVKKV